MRPTICFVHLLNFQGVFAPLYDIVIEFIPERQSSNLRARKFCYRVKVQPVEAQPSKIEYENREEEQSGAEIEEPKHPGGIWDDNVGITSSFCVCKCDSENVLRKVPVHKRLHCFMEPRRSTARIIYLAIVGMHRGPACSMYEVGQSSGASSQSMFVALCGDAQIVTR